MSAKTSSPRIKVPVRFMGVSHGVETVSIGVKFERNDFNDKDALGALVKRRIAVRLDRVNSKDAEGQTKLKGVEDVSVVGSADTARLSFGASDVSVRLTFNPVDLEDQEIVLLHHQRGTMTIKSSGEIPVGNARPEVDPEVDG